jgi:hypothetical protein
MISKNFKPLLVFTLFLICSQAFALDYYWVGGNGQWSEYKTHWATSSGGAIFHDKVPTPADNVYFDDKSFLATTGTITLNQTTITCKSLVFTTGTKIVTVQGGSASTTLNIYGDFKLARGVKFNFAGDVNLKASAGVNTIAQNGGQIISQSKFIFDGPGAEWVIGDSLAVRAIYLQNGKLTAVGKKITCSEFYSQNTQTREIDFTNTKIKGIANWNVTTTNAIFKLTGSKITFTSLWRFVSEPAVVTYDSLVAVNSADITGNLNIRSLWVEGYSLGLTGKVNIDDLYTNVNTFYKWNGTTKINKAVFDGVKDFNVRDSLELNLVEIKGQDCKTLLRLYGNDQGIITKKTGTLNIEYAFIRDIKFIGGATFSGSNIVDLGGVTGITYTPADSRTMYWIGGQGNWNDPAKWSYSSGGPAAGCLPTPLNDVIFDQNSFDKDGQEVSLSGNCKTIDFTKSTFSPKISGGLYVYGSVKLKAGMNVSSLGNFYLKGSAADNILDLGGNNTSNTSIYIDCIGEYTLSDSIRINRFYIYSGKFYSNNKNIYCSEFNSSTFVHGSRKIRLGSSRINITGGSLELSSDFNNLTFDAGTSEFYLDKGWQISLSTGLKLNNIYLKNTMTYALYAINCSFNKVYFEKKGQIRGLGNTFDTLVVTSGEGVTFQAGSSHTIKQLIVDKPTCNYTILHSDGTEPVELIKTSGIVNLTNVSLKGIKATGGAVFNAFNAIDLGGNSGWKFSKSTVNSMYWIGGEGNWNDPQNWSLKSGGSPSGCLPSANTNIYFDENSFTENDQKVTVNDASASCRNFYWNTTVNKGSISGGKIIVYGNFQLEDSIKIHDTNIQFANSIASILKTSGSFIPQLNFEGRGSVLLTDNLRASYLFINSGIVNFKNRTIRSDYFYIGSRKELSLNIDSTRINVDMQFSVERDSLELSTTGSVITVKGNNMSQPIFIAQYYWEGTPQPLDFNIIKIIPGRDNSMEVDEYNYFYMEKINVNQLEIGEFSNIEVYCSSTTVYNFKSSAQKCKLSGDYNYFFRAVLSSQETSVLNDYKFDHLKVDPGKTLKIASGKTLQITETLEAPGLPGFPIYIISSEQGSQATISIPSGNFCFDYLYISDIKATGGATYIAGLNSSNISNNSGWKFNIPCDKFYATYTAPVCAGSDFQLSANGNNYSSYSWTGPGNFVSSERNPVVKNATVFQSGLYEVTADGRKAVVFVEVEETPQVIISTFNYSLVSDNSGLKKYQWYKNNSVLEEETASSILLTSAGEYFLTVESKAGCKGKSNLYKVQIEDTYYPEAPENLMVSDYTFSDITFTWEDETDKSSAYIIERSNSVSGKFEKITSVYGDVRTYTDKNLLSNTSYFYRIKGYNYLGESDYSNVAEGRTDIITGNEEEFNSYVTIYPNPADDLLNISIKDQIQGDVKIRLTDMLGKEVLSTIDILSNVTLNVQHLSGGLYILHITDGARTYEKEVLIK